ncbi:MAG: cell division protein SepF [Actinobacteria bacterium]|nr:cell division protein SepF [Actinomycetota bacterium]
MGLAQSLRAVVDQLGGAGDDYDDYDYDDDTFAGSAECERHEAPRRERATADYDDIYRDEPLRRSPSMREPSARPLALVRPPRVGFSLVTPRDFDAAQQIADHLRADRLVIVDLESCGPDLSKRLTDFCSGLTYALEGNVEYIGEKVMLLTPPAAEVSSEALGGLQERRFFNQV